MDARLEGLRRVEGGIRLTWSDEVSCELGIRRLRQECPCAFCVDEVTGVRRLDPDSVPAGVELVDMQPVGRYAYRILFGDGHDSGIYTLEMLRGLCLAEARG